MAGFAACLMGCSTIQNAGIVGQDSLRFPIVGMAADTTVSEGGLVVKATPNLSKTQDEYTNAIQGGYVHSWMIPLHRNFRLSLAGGVSGYYARNTLIGVFDGTEIQRRELNGFGFTCQFKPALFIGNRESRFMLAGNFTEDWEFGDYRDFRQTFESLNANPYVSKIRTDYSPDGVTFSGSVNAGYVYAMEDDTAMSVELGAGFISPSGTDIFKSTLSVYSATLSYTGRHIWIWLTGDYVKNFSSGISMGMGLRIR